MTEQEQQRETTMQMPGKAHSDPRCGCGECVGYLTAWENVCSPLMLELATLRSTPAMTTAAATTDYVPDRHRDSIHIADLSPDAQEVMRRVVAKFRAGAKEHGPLSVTTRHWGPELLNEAIDMLHYAIFELMRLEQIEQASRMFTRTFGGDRHIDAFRRIRRENEIVFPPDGLPLGDEWDNPETGGGTGK